MGPALSGGHLRARSRTISKQGTKKPMAHTIPLLWSKLKDRKVKNTVWNSVSSDTVQFNPTELETLFGTQPDIISPTRVAEIGKNFLFCGSQIFKMNF